MKLMQLNHLVPEEDAVYNKLTSAQIERLAILSEELGEAQQIVGKILRHGFMSYNPFDINAIPNQLLLTKELGDVLYAVKLLQANGEILISDIEEFSKQKEFKIKPYLHHNSGDINV